LVPLATTSPDPVNCRVDQDNFEIFLNPAERDDQGEYAFCLKTCVSYVVDGASGAEDVVCSESAPFKVILEDPCDTTEIVSAGFDRVMGKPQLQSEELSLAEEIQFNNGFGSWPWTVQVDNKNPDPAFYGTFLCGEIEYRVEGPPGLVTIGPNFELKFAPTLDHNPGTYEMALVGRLPNGIEAVETFDVVVTQCQADIISVDAQMTLSD